MMKTWNKVLSQLIEFRAMKASTYALFLCATVISLVRAQDDDEVEDLDEVDQEGAESFPYKADPDAGMDMGRGMALAFPTWVVWIIAAGLFGALGYGVWFIFDTEAQKVSKAEEKEAAAVAKRAKKAAKKKSKGA
jgi:hypothetical protein